MRLRPAGRGGAAARARQQRGLARRDQAGGVSGRKVGQGSSRPSAQRLRRRKKQSSQLGFWRSGARSACGQVPALSSRQVCVILRRRALPTRRAAIMPLLSARRQARFRKWRSSFGFVGLPFRPMASRSAQPGSRPRRRCSRAGSSTSSPGSIPRCRRSSSSRWSSAAIWLGLDRGLSAPGPIALLVLAGLVIWTPTEYWLHRLVFHWQPKFRGGDRLHFIIHGVHHDHPNDAMRLVMPPAASIPLAALFFGLFVADLRHARTPSRCSPGFIAGYLVYDYTHYHVHHHTPKTELGRKLREQHMRHHFQDHHYGFGVSSPLWDVVFRTLPRRRKAERAARRRDRAALGDPAPRLAALEHRDRVLGRQPRHRRRASAAVAEPMCGSSTQRGASSSSCGTSGSFS